MGAVLAAVSAAAAGCGPVSSPGAASVAGAGAGTPGSSVAATAARRASPSASPSVPSRPGAIDGVRPTPTIAGTRTGPAFVVTRFEHVHLDDGDVVFAPPPAGVRPVVSGARAFALARRYWPDPHGTVTPVVALALYTNNGQGRILPGGGVRRFDVRRLTWVVIDDGADCSSTGGPAPPSGSPDRVAPVVHHDCLFLTFVDARTGADRGSTDEGGPAVDDLRTS